MVHLPENVSLTTLDKIKTENYSTCAKSNVFYSWWLFVTTKKSGNSSVQVLYAYPDVMCGTHGVLTDKQLNR